MENNNNRSHSKKVRNLVILSFLCALVLGVSTYAWFIGMKTVNVSTFEVKVATTEGLYISLDANNWAYNLDINSAHVYEKNTNKISNVELIPVSTIGRVDKTASTMELFEKASLTATDAGNAQTNKKGYRLLSSRVNNYAHTDDNDMPWELTGAAGAETGQENPEVAKTGYLVFDLFIKNVSGEEYYVQNNKLNEEAIYLTTNSKVTVSETGGVEGTGIENSVRVAFAQIGRVEDVTSNYGDARATKITCADVGHTDGTLDSGVAANQTITGICRDAYIWEPNDMAHVQNAINWYALSTGADKTTVAANWANYVTTSAIGDVIDTANGIDIYEVASTSTVYGTDTARENKGIYQVDYFTDTEKMQPGTARKEFMTLAPNSITKVRVYVYLEGQDVDNYDFASLGKQISVNFGFTKERFQEADIDYSGPNTYITPTDSATVASKAGDTNGTEIENGYENNYPITGTVVPTESVAHR